MPKEGRYTPEEARQMISWMGMDPKNPADAELSDQWLGEHAPENPIHVLPERGEVPYAFVEELLNARGQLQAEMQGIRGGLDQEYLGTMFRSYDDPNFKSETEVTVGVLEKASDRPELDGLIHPEFLTKLYKRAGIRFEGEQDAIAKVRVIVNHDPKKSETVWIVFDTKMGLLLDLKLPKAEFGSSKTASTEKIMVTDGQIGDMQRCLDGLSLNEIIGFIREFEAYLGRVGEEAEAIAREVIVQNKLAKAIERDVSGKLQALIDSGVDHWFVTDKKGDSRRVLSLGKLLNLLLNTEYVLAESQEDQLHEFDEVYR